MKIRYYFFLLITLVVFSLPVYALAHRWCDLCGMDLNKYRLTVYILSLDDGTRVFTCSIHCAAIVLNKGKVKKVEVADYPTGEMLDANEATYVLDSDIRGVMSGNSKLAFVSRNEAEKFQKEHGGLISDLRGALKMVEEDMAGDMIMLKNKVKKIAMLGKIVADTNSCFVCHGKEGRGGVRNPGSITGAITGWDTKKFASRINSKAELKEVILAGITDNMKKDRQYMVAREKARIKMPSWEGFIKGEELHALVNYIWSLGLAQKYTK